MISHPDGATSPTRRQRPVATTLCNNISLDETLVANAPGKAFHSFTKGGGVGPFFVEYLVTLPGSDASDNFNTLRDALKSCKQWTEPATSGGTPTA